MIDISYYQLYGLKKKYELFILIFRRLSNVSKNLQIKPLTTEYKRQWFFKTDKYSKNYWLIVRSDRFARYKHLSVFRKNGMIYFLYQHERCDKQVATGVCDDLGHQHA